MMRQIGLRQFLSSKPVHIFEGEIAELYNLVRMKRSTSC
jgi:hypothetical protein